MQIAAYLTLVLEKNDVFKKETVQTLT